MDYTGSKEFEEKEISPIKDNPEENNEKATIDADETKVSELPTHEDINLGDIYHEPFAENAIYD
jgi:hypothetical protein